MKIKMLIALFILGIQFNISAQDTDAKNHRIDRLISSLNLTDDQANEVKEIFDAYHSEEASENRKENREALHNEIAEVLTEEQLVKFEEIKSKGHKGRKGRKGKGEGKKYVEKDEEVLERLLEMRVALDEQLNNEEKATIDEVRSNIENLKSELKEKSEGFRDLSSEEKKALKTELKPLKEEIKTEHGELKVIAEKYEEDIKALFDENKDFFDDKKAQRKEAWEQKKEELKEEGDSDQVRGKKPRGKKGKRGGKGARGKDGSNHFAKPIHFLLLDPSANEDAREELIQEMNTISASPNPANAMTNVSFEVKEAGLIRVEIRDESGKVFETLANEVLEAGSYTRQVNTDKYLDKIYYISISDGKSLQTEKLIIQK